MRFLAIAGSLRRRSSNMELLRAAAVLAPPGVEVVAYDGLGSLPHFNPDIDIDPPLPAVQALRAQVESADALLISSPEYAHGVPGVLKNALDWLVSGIEIVGKPIGLLSASPRATHAQRSLAETLGTMSAVVVPSAQVAIPLLGRDVDAAAIAADSELAAGVRGALAALVKAVDARSPNSEPEFR